MTKPIATYSVIILVTLFLVGSAVIFTLNRQTQPQELAVIDPRMPLGKVSVLPTALPCSKSATTAPCGPTTPDLALGNNTRLITSPFASGYSASSLYVEKDGKIHAEAIYSPCSPECDIISEKDIAGITLPALVPGGIIFRTEYKDIRKLALYDIATVSNVADPDSFQYASGTARYFKDKFHTYSLPDPTGAWFNPGNAQLNILPGMDPQTFHFISADPDLVADAHMVYFHDVPHPEIDARIIAPDQREAGVYNSINEFRDDKYAYRFSSSQWDPSNPYTVKPMDRVEKILIFDAVATTIGKANSGYTQKNGTIYYEEKPILGVDAKSFVLLIGLNAGFVGNEDATVLYARDNKQVYYQGNSIPEADPKTFIPIAIGGNVHSYGVDTNHVFLGKDKIAGADPKTLKILWYIPKEGCAPGQYAKDRAHVYYGTNLVQGADAKTFEAFLNGYARDKKHIYLSGIMQPQSVESFTPPVCNYG